MKQDERELLSKFVQSKQEIDNIELTLKRGRAFWLRFAYGFSVYLAGWLMLWGAVFFILNDMTLHTKISPLSIIALIVGIILCIWSIKLLLPIRHTQALRHAVQAMIRALSRVDSTIGTNPISKERKTLATQLRRCASQVRSLGPFPTFTFQGRVIRKCATEASGMIRSLIILTLLGDDDELKIVKTTLEAAILKLGTSKWVEIKAFPVEFGQHSSIMPAPRAWGQSVVLPLTLAALTAIPAIPILVHYF